MKKFTLPKLVFSKKNIIIVSSIAILLITSIVLIIIFSRPDTSKNSLAQTLDRNNTEGLELADDSQSARTNTFQETPASDDGLKIQVYGETAKSLYSGNTQAITMTESCQYEGMEEPKETTYTLGANPIEVNNYCTFSLGVVFDSTETVDTLTAYFILPDNSLIALSSNLFPEIQINMFENETRIVQLTGSAYYRIAPQGSDKIFTIQMMGLVFTATGTELYTEEGFTDQSENSFGISKGDFITGFALYDGSGYITNRGSNDILQEMRSDDSTHITYYSFAKYVADKIEGVTNTLDVLGMGDFLSNQKELSSKYGFDNFKSFTTEKLQAFVYDRIENVQALSVTAVEKRYKEINDEWESKQEDNNSSNSGSSSSSGSAVCSNPGTAAYQACRMGMQSGGSVNYYMNGSQCCTDMDIAEPTLTPIY